MDPFLKWFLIVCVLVFILYKYGTRNFAYWKKKGIEQLQPIPFIGSNLLGGIKRADIFDITEEHYKPFRGKRFGGFYVGQKPFLAVTDPELLRQIMIKDADSFFNRYEWLAVTDPLLGKNLFSLKDENWRKMRSVMTTVFTSAKMKDMFCFMDKCGEQAVEYLKEKMVQEKNSGKSLYEMDCKEFYSRYGTDVIASTAFGLEVDSFKNPNNEFYESGYVIRQAFSGKMMFKMLFIMTFPNIAKKLGISFFGEKYNKFFTSLISDTIRIREEQNIVRKDVINILMESRKGKGVDENGDLIKGKLPDLTDLDIAAQGIVFFFGGFETIATLLGFVTYELALNPDIQEKLQAEIDEIVEKENGITYDGVMHQMEYLNMVINETLRKWPPAAMTDRVVTKTYVIPKTETSPELVLNKGDTVWIPITAFHYDPEFFPNPHKFDPERFRDEKNTIKPFTYLPFGEGLRHCVGMRYALMEAKTILVHFLRKYSVVPGPKTSIPLKIQKNGPFALLPESGFWLGVEPR